MNKYLIRLNGMPFFWLTCPYWMSPTAAARDYLLTGNLPDGVKVESCPS